MLLFVGLLIFGQAMAEHGAGDRLIPERRPDPRPDKNPAEGHVAGTPEQCVARIRRYVEAGVRHFLFTIPDVASSAGLACMVLWGQGAACWIGALTIP